MTQKKAIEILEAMHELFKDYPTTELNYETPFQCLMAVMLSAQTTDKQVNKVTATLFQEIKTPTDIVEMGEKTLGKKIGSIGLRKAKAKNLVGTASKLLTMTENMKSKKPPTSTSVEVPPLSGWRPSPPAPLPEGEGSYPSVYKDSMEVYECRGYLIPDTIEEMVELPGVGIKTAKVVLYVLYRQRRVAVDTHVHRVMNRLGVVKTKTPDQTSKQLETIIPDEYKDIAHHVIIYFGRYLCTAKKPQCERCPLTEICPYYKDMRKKKVK